MIGGFKHLWSPEVHHHIGTPMSSCMKQIFMSDTNFAVCLYSDIANLLQSSGRLEAVHKSNRLAPDVVPCLSQCLKFPLVRLCIEITRLSHSNHARCTKRDVLFAVQRILPFPLFSSCKTVCQKAAAYYMCSFSRDQSKAPKGEHAGLQLDIGKIHGFMIEKRVARFVHDSAAVYLTATLQCIVEELLLGCCNEIPLHESITNTWLERTIFKDAEFFGVFQQWKHLQVITE